MRGKKQALRWFEFGTILAVLLTISCSGHEAQPVPTVTNFPTPPATDTGLATVGEKNPLTNPKAPSEAVTAALKNQRAAKDYSFKNLDQSPIPAEIRGTFKGLEYYPVDLNYRFVCRMKTCTSTTPVAMQTSTGELRQYRCFGSFEFKIGTQTYSLTGFKTADPASPLETALIFVPFKDATSGKETYGAGRYLELEQTTSGEYVIDFNRAFNPFCAYNPNFSCPIPPAENVLKAAIPAGEKLPPFGKH